ncbi:MAG: sarcosine oxidase subunit alpha family protein [Pseudomonadota bacterium]
MSQTARLDGGLLDRSLPLRFKWNGVGYSGYQGDTLASALLANGEHLVGRSFKYHRPRGIFSAGSEEPNALVQLGPVASSQPNTRATTVELAEGLSAHSQNHRGPLKWDLMSVTDLLAPFLGAGFYYKTFMWPKAFWEKLYEPAIRASAGLGRLSGAEDPGTYDHGFLHCDVLVVGAGPAGLMAAQTAARAGLQVILADEDFRLGGRLNAETLEVGGQPGAHWAAETVAALQAESNVRVMSRTAVFGAFDHGIYGALETAPPGGETSKPGQILWRVYAKRAIVAAGATERSIAFGNNDRPGIMQAGAVRAYVNRFGVAPGRRVAVLSNNDDGLRTAADLEARGIEVAAVLDARKGEGIRSTSGRRRITGVTLANGAKVAVDCLAVSGGWSPNLHLSCHQRGRPVWDAGICAFVPGAELPPGMVVCGAAKGEMTLAAALRGGAQAAQDVARDLGKEVSVSAPQASDEPHESDPIFHLPPMGSARAWVDLQNDVTTKDIRIAHAEGFTAVEHMKRCTTLGMATDQGKTANVLGLAVMADLQGQGIADTGTTIFRPPYIPVSIGALAGRSRGKDFRPTRHTPSHAWAAAHGADFVEVGPWLRAQWFKRPGEAGWRDAVDREVRMTRASVGICDVTTLGKIDIQGRDAAEFLNRIYSNPFLKVPVGKVRYGLMLREDGVAYDDGTTARLSETHFVMTTTTANAVTVFRNLEFARQCLWPDLDVHLNSITDAWAQFAVAGPNSRALLSGVVDDLDLSNEGFPFMACTDCTVFGGVPARLFRISFSGELAYEVAVPARYGNAMMAALMEAGAPYEAVPYGTEALGVMRIEKGHVAGNELNGQTTAHMLGMGGMVSLKKDAIGTRLSQRPEMVREDDLRLMGFRPVDGGEVLIAGAHFLTQGDPADMAHDQGWMSSVAYSPTLGHAVGLGFLKNGADRIGEVVMAHSPVRGGDMLVEVCSPHHIDPDGERQRG